MADSPPPGQMGATPETKPPEQMGETRDILFSELMGLTKASPAPNESEPPRKREYRFRSTMEEIQEAFDKVVVSNKKETWPIDNTPREPVDIFKKARKIEKHRRRVAALRRARRDAERRGVMPTSQFGNENTASNDGSASNSSTSSNEAESDDNLSPEPPLGRGRGTKRNYEPSVRLSRSERHANKKRRFLPPPGNEDVRISDATTTLNGWLTTEKA
jgi:hypothetical protein